MEWKHAHNPERQKNLIEHGFCPVCEMKVISVYHIDCEVINKKEWLLFYERHQEYREDITSTDA